MSTRFLQRRLAKVYDAYDLAQKAIDEEGGIVNFRRAMSLVSLISMYERQLAELDGEGSKKK